MITGPRSVRSWLLALLALGAYGRALADNPEPTDPLSAACPGAAQWRDAHPDRSLKSAASHDEGKSFSEPQLYKQLKERVDRDQAARRAYLNTPLDAALARRLQSIDTENLAWLKKQVRDGGIPTVAQVGESGLIRIWLLVQHADSDRQFQASVLPTFVQRFQAGELDAEYVAKLTDRLLQAAGKQQMYGTQFDWLSGEFKPRDLGNMAEIDAHRDRLGLMPLSDYACMMNLRLHNRTETEPPP